MQSTFISAEQLVFTRVKHASCWSRDKQHTLSHPPPPHTDFQFPFLSVVIIHCLLSFKHSCLLSVLLFYPFSTISFIFVYRSFFLHLLHFLSQDPLMSAQTCCHIPPVQLSAGQHRNKEKSAAVDGTGLTTLDRSRQLGSSSEKVWMAQRNSKFTSPQLW